MFILRLLILSRGYFLLSETRGLHIDRGVIEFFGVRHSASDSNMGRNSKCEQGLYFFGSAGVLFPGLMVAITALCLNTLGDTLRGRYGLHLRQFFFFLLLRLAFYTHGRDRPCLKPSYIYLISTPVTYTEYALFYPLYSILDLF